MPLTAEDVARLSVAYRMSRSLAAAAELQVAAVLADGPLPVAEVALRLAVDARGLRLLLRALASEGVFAEPSPDTFALNDAARVLLPSSDGGMAELLTGWWGHPAVYRGLERLADGVRTGRPAFELNHSTSFFGWLQSHPDELASYLHAVGGEEPEEFVGMLDVIDLSTSSVIADVGGGGGGLVRAARQRWPHLGGMLIDLPAVVDRVGDVLRAEGITCIAADAVQEVPPGADVYVMTTVLRYFDDQRAGRVLANIYAALAAGGGGRLILSEMPVDEGAATAPGAMKSLVEFALSGGEDRSSAELTGLLEKAGFRDVTHRHWDGPYWITEAVGG